MFKVAIGERRILAVDADHVHFRYQKPHSTRGRTMTLPVMEFMRRFLQHVLPRGFMKVRYYGFLSPSASASLGGRQSPDRNGQRVCAAAPEATSEPPAALRCRHCGGVLRFSRLVLPEDSAIGWLAALGQRASESSPSAPCRPVPEPRRGPAADRERSAGRAAPRRPSPTRSRHPFGRYGLGLHVTTAMDIVTLTVAPSRSASERE